MFKRSVKGVFTIVFVFAMVSFAKAGNISVIAPLDGVGVNSNDIVIIGKAGQSIKELQIKGTAKDNLKVKVNNGGFFAKVKLPDSDNTINLSATDGSSLDLHIKVSKTGGFNYHPDMDEALDCASTCHTDVEKNGYAVKSSAGICYECHDVNNDKAYVHGPVNMGICTVCHRPHGSDAQMFLVTDKKILCNGCHDSLMSSHPDTTSKLCIDCHDPHSSDKEFHIK